MTIDEKHSFAYELDTYDAMELMSNMGYDWENDYKCWGDYAESMYEVLEHSFKRKKYRWTEKKY